MSDFHRDTNVRRLDQTRWQANLARGWRIGDVPCGGYTMAIAARALSEALQHPDPLSVHMHYLAPTSIGNAIMEVEILRTGGSTSHGLLRLYQGSLKAVATAICTTLDASRGPSWTAEERPIIRANTECIPFKGRDVELRQRVNQCFHQGYDVMANGATNDGGCFEGWLSFADGANVDLFGLLLFADAFPPPIFTVTGAQSWVPTIELTVQLRAQPCAGPIQVRFRSRYMTNGIVEEDGELWDSDGQLVAISRQMARLRPSAKARPD